MIRRFANERGIYIDEENIIQNAYGGIGISILHNGKQWLIESDEYNEKFILSHLNLGANRKRKNHYHEHMRSSYYDLVIQHIFTHHNINERRVTKKNKDSISLEQAFRRLDQEKKNRNNLKLVK